jgi:cytosine/adenosine deaminase-related metal-dependent hydrolase
MPAKAGMMLLGIRKIRGSTMRRALLLWATLWAGPTLAASEYHYTMTFSGRVSGEHVTRIADDGSITTVYSYRDNGRGPDYAEKIALDANGLIRAYDITGKSTFGSPADEHFVLEGKHARWKGAVDHGEARVKVPSIYVPIENTIEVDGITLRALIRAPGQKLKALPDGELSTARVLATTLDNGKEKLAVALYATRGFSLDPVYQWMSADGERAFAEIIPGISQLILKGWEAQADALEKLQVAAQEQYLRDVATRNRHELPQPLLVRNARIFDAEHATLGPLQDVYVDHGRIATICEANSPPQDVATVIDAGGRVLLPGLFDMHAHVTPSDYLLNLAAGITTVRDMGNDNATLAGYIARLERHESIGPHIVAAGFVEGKSPYYSAGGITVDSLEEAKRAVDWYAQRGFPQIKIYNSFHPEWVQETAAYAHKRGLRVSGHIPAFMKAEEAVRAGYDEIQHINQVLLNFYVKPDTDTRTLARFTLIADNAHALDFDGQPFRDLVDLFVAHHTVLDSTLATFEGQFTQKSGEMNPSYATIAPHLPITLRRGLLKADSDLTDDIAPRWRASYRKMVEAVGRFHRAGIPLVAGTDQFAGFTLQRELELYVQAGIPANEVLRIATWNGATYARVLADRGSIERGKRADLILVDGDPTQDIGALRNVALVLQDGDAYYPAELYDELGVTPFAPAVKPLH